MGNYRLNMVFSLAMLTTQAKKVKHSLVIVLQLFIIVENDSLLTFSTAGYDLKLQSVAFYWSNLFLHFT